MANKYNTLSANTLFHFTNSIDNLVGILSNEFYPRYCPEDHSVFHKKQSIFHVNSKRAIPMVCFCDIPLSQIRNHIRTYGHYAIGLSKAWGIKNKVSPVMYTLPNSNSTTCLKDSFDYLVTKFIVSIGSPFKTNAVSSADKELAEIVGKLDNIIYYTKPYEGSFKRGGKLLKKVRFYDEREWRYIPEMALLRNNKIMTSIPNDDLLDERVKYDMNANISKHCRLSFTPKDIKYIVVRYNAEILGIIDRINEIKSNKYDGDEVKLLKTRIISAEQILEDF